MLQPKMDIKTLSMLFTSSKGRSRLQTNVMIHGHYGGFQKRVGGYLGELLFIVSAGSSLLRVCAENQ